MLVTVTGYYTTENTNLFSLIFSFIFFASIKFGHILNVLLLIKTFPRTKFSKTKNSLNKIPCLLFFVIFFAEIHFVCEFRRQAVWNSCWTKFLVPLIEYWSHLETWKQHSCASKQKCRTKYLAKKQTAELTLQRRKAISAAEREQLLFYRWIRFVKSWFLSTQNDLIHPSKAHVFLSEVNIGFVESRIFSEKLTVLFHQAKHSSLFVRINANIAAMLDMISIFRFTYFYFCSTY